MTGSPSRDELEVMASALEASGEYRVVRRLVTPDLLPSLPAGARVGLVVDVETTGADLRGDEVIELAMVRFAYTPAGEVLGVVDTFQGYHEPTRAISAEISALTGISAETVAGHALDPEAVGAFVAPAVIVLAHNAAFDRRFAERLHPYFSTKAWGCTMNEPPWREEGFEGLKLAYLAAQSGVFYDKHRALHDCHATLHLLSRSLPASGPTALAHLLELARRPSFRLWAEGAVRAQGHAQGPRLPLERRRGRQAAGLVDRPGRGALDGEVAFLRQHVYGYKVEPLQRRVTAYDRYSGRV